VKRPHFRVGKLSASVSNIKRSMSQKTSQLKKTSHRPLKRVLTPKHQHTQLSLFTILQHLMTAVISKKTTTYSIRYGTSFNDKCYFKEDYTLSHSLCYNILMIGVSKKSYNLVHTVYYIIETTAVVPWKITT
jgi:hypothetical protein